MKNLLKGISRVMGVLAVGFTMGVILTKALHKERYDEEFYIFGPDDEFTDEELYGESAQMKETNTEDSLSYEDLAKEIENLKNKVKAEEISYIKINTSENE